MAKSTLPKSTKTPAGKTSRTKRPSNAPVTATVPSPVQSGSFALPTGAFTVAAYDDPGPKQSRHSFAKIPHVLDIPDLIELQKASFNWFVTEGLKEAFESISPIKDF